MAMYAGYKAVRGRIGRKIDAMPPGTVVEVLYPALCAGRRGEVTAVHSRGKEYLSDTVIVRVNGVKWALPTDLVKIVEQGG